MVLLKAIDVFLEVNVTLITYNHRNAINTMTASWWVANSGTADYWGMHQIVSVQRDEWIFCMSRGSPFS